MAEKEFGCLHLYCGDGKGKTTAAVGLALRALGQGKRVLFVSLMKGTPSGELKVLESLPGCRVLYGKQDARFSFQMDDRKKRETRDRQNQILREVGKRVENGEYDMVVLDELCSALSEDLLDRDLADRLLAQCRGNVELVVTGRNPPQAYRDQADYLSEIRAVRHPYEKGLPARRGIEW